MITESAINRIMAIQNGTIIDIKIKDQNKVVGTKLQCNAVQISLHSGCITARGNILKP